MREDKVDLQEEVGIAIDRMLHWLDVYINTRELFPTSKIELQRAVMDAALAKASDGIKKQLEQYEVEEVERLRREEERRKSTNPKKGWYIHTTEGVMGVNWSFVERIEQEKFENKKRFFLYRKHRSEIMCKCHGNDGASCENCYGTGFEGGWTFTYSFPAVNVIVDTNPDENDDGRPIGDLQFRVSQFRTITPGDVIVDEEGLRWRVLGVEGSWNQKKDYGWKVHAFTVHPTLGESKFPLTHNKPGDENA